MLLKRTRARVYVIYNKAYGVGQLLHSTAPGGFKELLATGQGRDDERLAETR